MMIRTAPWKKEEVQSLTEFQSLGYFHEFTCARRDDGNHCGGGALVPTVRGWICQYCEYTQNWAHDFMLNGTHRASGEALKAAGFDPKKVKP